MQAWSEIQPVMDQLWYSPSLVTSGAESTKERLFRSAAVEIARHGYRGASLRRVAAGAEIKAASIFHYFPKGKEELVRGLLNHIMETIATRMTPTIDSNSGLSPADLIVHCTALLWDFMAQHPEYAGALMREAFQPDPDIMEVVRDRAELVVTAATMYFESCQSQGELAVFDVRRFLFRMASYVMTFHGAPSMRHYILGQNVSFDDERTIFLESVRNEITRGTTPSSP
jgi:AcrR family transcriptional regulator